MCQICQGAMDAVKPTNDGATADAWNRADAAIRAWIAANPGLEFDDVIDESMAWADHMAHSS